MNKAHKNLNKSIHYVFSEIQKTIETVGESGFVNMLIELREDKELIYQNEITKSVIQIVCSEFEISSKELLYGKSRLNDKTHALGIITYILMNNFGYLLKDISFALNKNNTNLSRYKTEVDNYDPTHPLDVIRLDKMETIEHKIKIYKKHYEQSRQD